MAGRFYYVPYTGTLANSTGNADLFECVPAAGKPVRLHGFTLGQTSEVADTAEEAISLSVLLMTATVSSSNGTTVTPVRVNLGDQTFSGTSECNGGTVATTSGSTSTLCELAWNVRNTPYEYWFPPEFRPYAKNAEGLFVRCNTTVADDITICMTFFIEEEG